MRPSELLPLYNPQLEAVAFVKGADKSDIDPEGVKALAEGDQLKYLLDFLLSESPGEARRFYAMVSGGFSVSSQTAGMVTVGPSLKPARIHYLGKVTVGSVELELVEWLSEEKLDQNLTKQLRLGPQFIGQKAQILYGQAVFSSTERGYMLIACRFVASEEGLEWIMPLVEGIELVPDSEQTRAGTADRVREIIRSALSAAGKKKYSQALEQLEQALELAPEDENALDLKGAVLVRQNKNAEAETILRKAIAINPDHDSAHFNLGVALMNLEKKHEAVREFELVQRISPLYPRIDEIVAQAKSSTTK